jgi:hypothetical protein
MICLSILHGLARRLKSIHTGEAMLQKSPMYAYIPARDLSRAAAAWFKDSEGNIMAIVQPMPA